MDEANANDNDTSGPVSTKLLKTTSILSAYVLSCGAGFNPMPFTKSKHKQYIRSVPGAGSVVDCGPNGKRAKRRKRWMK